MKQLDTGTDSRWPFTTFSAEVVARIARCACPDLKFIADAADQAEAMNDAARDLLFSLRANAKASAPETWANNIAEACENFVEAFGKPSIRSATRLGIMDEFDRFKDMLEMASHVRCRALHLVGNAARDKRTSTRSLTMGENAWLNRMAAIFETCFGRRGGVTLYIRPIGRNQAIHERGGRCPAFIAAAAAELAADFTIVDPPDRWKAAIYSLSSQKTVARRLQNRECKDG